MIYKEKCIIKYNLNLFSEKKKSKFQLGDRYSSNAFFVLNFNFVT